MIIGRGYIGQSRVFHQEGTEKTYYVFPVNGIEHTLGNANKREVDRAVELVFPGVHVEHYYTPRCANIDPVKHELMEQRIYEDADIRKIDPIVPTGMMKGETLNQS